MTTDQRPDVTQLDPASPEPNDNAERVLTYPRISRNDLAALSKQDKDSSLSALVRQWMRTSEALDRQSRPPGDDSPLLPKWTPPNEDPIVSGGVAMVATPALPRRRRQVVARPTRRLAVLIDVQTTAADSAGALFHALEDQGTVSVCRAYGDWTSPATRAWWPGPLREHGIQPHHHFGNAQDQRGLVALAIDAVDLAHEAAVDVVVIVGDLASLHPLIVRLNGSGIEVIAFGTTPTPTDVRELCHEFVDLSGDPGDENEGRHRA
ncbi:MAG: NYN domain-containing protein [Nocardioides sp.]|uniref:NYN domain-containing protein n=1 Tax=Nocardioides sp. TaxID=35761 RepID=UPI003262DF5E